MTCEFCKEPSETFCSACHQTLEVKPLSRSPGVKQPELRETLGMAKTYTVGEYELDGGELDTFYKLFWFGSQDDGDLPSKSGMAGLIEKELAVKSYHPLGEIIGEKPNILTLHGADIGRKYYHAKYRELRKTKAVGRLAIMGNIDVSEPDGEIANYPRALLISFDDADSIRAAIDDMKLTLINYHDTKAI